MKAQSQAAATSGVVRVPHMPSGADVSSSAAASEALTDTRSVAGGLGLSLALRPDWCLFMSIAAAGYALRWCSLQPYPSFLATHNCAQQCCV